MEYEDFTTTQIPRKSEYEDFTTEQILRKMEYENFTTEQIPRKTEYEDFTTKQFLSDTILEENPTGDIFKPFTANRADNSDNFSRTLKLHSIFHTPHMRFFNSILPAWKISQGNIFAKKEAFADMQIEIFSMFL